MIAPKYTTIYLAVAVACSAAVSAFTTPGSSIVPKSNIPVGIHSGQVPSLAPLHLLKKDMAEAEAGPLSKAMASSAPADIDNGKNDLIAPTIYASHRYCCNKGGITP